jgi:hypothetical protein
MACCIWLGDKYEPSVCCKKQSRLTVVHDKRNTKPSVLPNSRASLSKPFFSLLFIDSGAWSPPYHFS